MSRPDIYAPHPPHARAALRRDLELRAIVIDPHGSKGKSPAEAETLQERVEETQLPTEADKVIVA